MSKDFLPAVRLTREQKGQWRLAAVEELLEGEENQLRSPEVTEYPGQQSPSENQRWKKRALRC